MATAAGAAEAEEVDVRSARARVRMARSTITGSRVSRVSAMAMALAFRTLRMRVAASSPAATSSWMFLTSGHEVLRQLDLEVVVAAKTQGAAEAQDGRLAGAGVLRQLADGLIDDLCWGNPGRRQRNLLFGIAEVIEAQSDGAEHAARVGGGTDSLLPGRLKHRGCLRTRNLE